MPDAADAAGPVDGEPSPLVAGPAPVVTFTVPTSPPVTTTLVLPEKAGDHLTDTEWAGREALLACIRSYEGSYTSETGNGYHGAYQDTQSTWDRSVAMAGHPQWVGRLAGDAPPYVQDDAAWALFLAEGLTPWPTPAKRCRA